MSDEVIVGTVRRVAPDRPFDAVVLPELDVLFRVARSLTNTGADAEDLVQETLLRAYRSIETFDGRHARAWLLTILRNAERNRHRRQRPTLLADGDGMAAEIDRRNPPAPSAEDTATAGVPPSWVIDALDHLTPKLRRVVQLVDVDGLTYDEAAAVLDIPAGTVMSRLHRARQRMHARLEHHPDFRRNR